MSVETWIKLGAFVLLSLLVGLARKYNSSRPPKQPDANGLVRQPKYIAVMGWVFNGLALILALAFFAAPAEGKIVLAILVVLFVAIGSYLVLHYKNWHIGVFQQEVVMRTATKKIKRVRYDSVKAFDFYNSGAVPMLRIVGNDGSKIETPTKLVNCDAIVQAISYYQQGGAQGVQFSQPPAQFPAPGAAPYSQGPPPGAVPFGQAPQPPYASDQRFPN